MKKVIAILLTMFLLTMPVLAVIDLVNEDIQITVSKAAVAPIIDGKLDADSYAKIPATMADYNAYGGDDEYDDWMKANLPEAYISYDANNFYVLLIGNGSKYFYCDHDEDSEGDIWNQSCIQISVATADASGGDRLEIGLALNSSTKVPISHIWAQSPDGREEYEIVIGTNAAILLDGGKLAYEVSIPWKTFLPKDPKAGDKFGFNFIYGYSDDGNRFGVEYSYGCCNGKNADLFAKVTITDTVLQAAPTEAPTEAPAVTDAPAAPTEPPNEVAPPPPPKPIAPKVGDIGAIMLIVTMAASGITLFRRKK